MILNMKAEIKDLQDIKTESDKGSKIPFSISQCPLRITCTLYAYMTEQVN